MVKRTLRFTVNQLIIDEKDRFEIDKFKLLKDDDTEKQEIGEPDAKEVLSVKRTHKEILEDRFLTFYFASGEKYPYSDKVIAPDLQELTNPRPPEQIELDKQLFVLVDLNTQRIYISDQRQKTNITSWLISKIKEKVVIKSIIDEAEFVDKIESINRISFAIAPDLFNSISQDTLSNNLVRDIFSFGAKRARLEFDYGSIALSDKVLAKIRNLIGSKNNFEDLVVIGRSDENFESIFNLEGVTNKIIIEIEDSDQTQLSDPRIVFDSLVSKLKQI